MSQYWENIIVPPQTVMTINLDQIALTAVRHLGLIRGGETLPKSQMDYLQEELTILIYELPHMLAERLKPHYGLTTKELPSIVIPETRS